MKSDQFIVASDWVILKQVFLKNEWALFFGYFCAKYVLRVTSFWVYFVSFYFSWLLRFSSKLLLKMWSNFVLWKETSSVIWSYLMSHIHFPIANQAAWYRVWPSFAFCKMKRSLMIEAQKSVSNTLMVHNDVDTIKTNKMDITFPFTFTSRCQ